jgi:lysyl-tRNA synthetase class 2
VWTALFSDWSDAHLDPWLRARATQGRSNASHHPNGAAVHVTGFPAALSALAVIRGGVARRFESYVHGIELANGYWELRDSAEQRERFARVNRLRAAHGAEPLPMPERFLAALSTLPPAAGVALGLERLIALAAGVADLANINLPVEPAESRG